MGELKHWPFECAARELASSSVSDLTNQSEVVRFMASEPYFLARRSANKKIWQRAMEIRQTRLEQEGTTRGGIHAHADP
jgi:hypothetical protein